MLSRRKVAIVEVKMLSSEVVDGKFGYIRATLDPPSVDGFEIVLGSRLFDLKCAVGSYCQRQHRGWRRTAGVHTPSVDVPMLKVGMTT